jgi:pantoate--beta-alanine ligase
MILFKKASDIHYLLTKRQKEGLQTGFVPTMGALHKGHISLIENCKKQNALTICSIFVNPTQFNDPADFEKYPHTLEKDIYMLETAGCDVLFLPSVEEIYPNETQHPVYDLGYLENILEGKYRPGHFQGVCQVVDRLLQIVQPDNLYIGQKDYQQCMILKRLLEITDSKTTIHICPTFREPDGLAMSSRNMRLTEAERRQATELFKTLTVIKSELKKGALIDIKEKAFQYLTTKGFKVDYVEITNASTLETIEEWNGKMSLVALIAAFLNEVRLIDNMILNIDDKI